MSYPEGWGGVVVRSIKEYFIRKNDVAIIGTSFRLPGNCHTLGSLWSLLKENKQTIQPLPKERWQWPEGLDIQHQYPGIDQGGFLNDIDQFAEYFFDISPREAKMMDPQQRILLELAWECFEDAGYKPSRLKNSNTGVYIGLGQSGYHQLFTQENNLDLSYLAQTQGLFLASNRISHYFNLVGPSLSIDTASSSALVAICQAVQALQAGHCTLAIAGGINLICSMQQSLAYYSAGMLSKDAQCKSFDQEANGYVRSEGGGLLILKPLKHAIHDKDFIYGVIKGAGHNHGGKTHSLTTPSVDGEARLIEQVYQRSGIQAESLSYIETHGSGTRVGDPIETQALIQAFKRLTGNHFKTMKCGLGSIKSQLGHLESASGLAGILKILAAFKYQELPMTSNHKQLNQQIDLTDTPFYIVNQWTPWHASSRRAPLRAGVSSFGLGGVNAHIILEKFKNSPKKNNASRKEKVELFIFSAKSKEDLNRYLKAFSHFLDVKQDANAACLESIAYSLQTTREEMQERVAYLAGSAKELKHKIDQTLRNEIKKYDYYINSATTKTTDSTEIYKFIQKRQLGEIAKLWVQGQEIYWESLYKNQPINKCKLPTYQFSHTRYWVSQANQQESHLKKPEVTAESFAKHVIEIIANILGVPSSEIDRKEYLSDMGFSSLEYRELSHQLNEKFQLNTTPVLFFERQNIEDIIARLSAQEKPRLLHSSLNNHSTEVAIIGIGALLPDAETFSQFWENLCNQKISIRQISEERPGHTQFLALDPVLQKAGFIEGVEEFDAKFFNISPLEAELMDPQQRKLLQVAWHTFEEAGVALHQASNRSVGVFIGAMHSDYQELLAEEGVLREAYTSTGLAHSMLANKISFFFNLQGPSEVIDTACSSSLVALHRALLSLNQGECEMALVGGVNLILSPRTSYAFQQSGMLSPDARCYTFDEHANGYVRGEGIVTLLLKPLHKAIQEKNQIYGVIKGSAVGHTGHGHSLTAPSATSQAHIIASALRRSNIDATSVSYIEAHGTGTALGDPIEIEGLKHNYAQSKCAIGTVKANLGHLEAAAGLAGVLKVILSFKHHTIPGNPNLTQINRYIDLSTTHMHLVQDNEKWSVQYPRRAGVSSFGFGGVGAHVILEEHQTQHESLFIPHVSNIFILSAKNNQSLGNIVHQFYQFVSQLLSKENQTIQLEDITYTLQIGREAMPKRLCIVANDLKELKHLLQEAMLSDQKLLGTINSSFKETIESWMKGGSIEWRQFYNGQQGKLISLPGYAFLTDKYWFNQSLNEKSELRIYIKSHVEVKTEPVVNDKVHFDSKMIFIIEANQILDETYETVQAYLQSKIKTAECVVLRTTEDNIALNYQNHLIAIFNRLKSKISKSSGRVSPILIQVVFPFFNEYQVYIGFSAFLKALHIEFPAIKVQIIGLDRKTKLEELRHRLDQSALMRDVEIMYSSEKRYITHWKEKPLLKKMPWKNQGVYLITGGFGALGYALATEITNCIQNGKIIICGRTALNENIQKKIQSLEKNNCKINYYSLDISDQFAINQMIVDIVSRHHGLSGIIHCAGMIKDNYIYNKSSDEFPQVLNPKVLGLYYLDKATKDLPLDFIILFSSFVGCMGNAGQSDYAAANAFMNQYAHYRNEQVKKNQRFGRTSSISWPLWESGGMNVTPEVEMHFKENLGMLPLEFSKGMESLYGALGIEDDEVIVAFGNQSIFSQKLNESLQCEMAQPVQSHLHSRNKKQNLSEIEDQIQSLFSKYSKVNLSDIHSDIEFSEFGMDSIMVININRELEKIYPNLSKTVLYECKTIRELADYLFNNYNQHPDQVQDTESERSDPRSTEIAIVGIAGRFPGANSIDEFCVNLMNGKDCITEIPLERWNFNEHFTPNKEEAINQNKIYSKWGGFIDNFNKFDSLFFNISPKEALQIDPHERLFLETAWHALEDAGIDVKKISGTNVGVFAGITKNGFEFLKNETDGFYPRTSFSSVANRVSFFFNLKGPSLAIDTMCSSSLVAVHEACQNILRGDCEIALAGGVNLYLHPSNYQYLCQMGMLSTTAENRSFGGNADGFVPGEGVGIAVLKPLSAAIRDGNHIYGIIKSSAVNHGGRTSGYTVPNPNAQRDLVAKAIGEAQISADAISYIEAHGTGTFLGDPIEITALTQAFQESTQQKNYCAIGSIKSNIGHLEAAAGIAGLIKILLQIKFKKKFPSIHSAIVNPNINFAESPFYLQHHLDSWIVKNNRRIAGVSSFGAGGVNAHVIVEEYRSKDDHVLDDGREFPCIFSCGYEEGLKNYAQALLTHLEFMRINHIHLSMRDIAYTLCCCRVPQKYRAVVYANNAKSLETKLKKYVSGEVDYTTHTELSPLSTAWLNGSVVDWRSLFEEKPGKSVSLPGYPFKKNLIELSTKHEKRAVVEKISLINPENFSENLVSAHQKCTTFSEIKIDNEQIAPPLESKKSQATDYSLMMEQNQFFDQSQTYAAIKCFLKTELAKSLFINEEEIDEKLELINLGLDSIVGIEFSKRIKSNFGIHFPATRIYDYPTIEKLAQFLLNETKNKINHVSDVKQESEVSHNNHNKIAIIGVSGRFPGAESIDEFWDNLKNGVNSITEVSNIRWDVNQFYDANKKNKNKVYCKWIGELSHIDEFDPLFFNLSPAEAECMDPQQRLFLQEAWKAFEDANYTPEKLSQIQCGSYIGVMQNDYWQNVLSSKEHSGLAQTATGNSNAILAARMAYLLNLKGPAIAVDTACSSSAVATHLACQALRLNEIDMALAGGVTLYLGESNYFRMCDAGMLSEDGQCFTFDRRANGFVPGEAVVAVVLKRLDDAIHDHDHIYGVITGSGINQDGKTNGITAPSTQSQIELIQSVYKKNEIDPHSISYIEAHGTGTKLGDPIELEALTTVYQKEGVKDSSCAIGSVKTNVGHTSAAAGLTSLVKILLCLQHKELVPSINYQTANEHIDFKNSPFYVSTQHQSWITHSGLRKAALSAFGYSGTNAHIVIEEYSEKRKGLPSISIQKPIEFLFSAQSVPSLIKNVKRFLKFIKSQEQIAQEHLPHIALTLRFCRDLMKYKIVFTASDKPELINRIQLFLENTPEESSQINMQASLSHLDTGISFKKFRLPTYCFAKNKYWISQKQIEPQPSAQLSLNKTDFDTVSLGVKFLDEQNEKNNESHYDVVLAMAKWEREIPSNSDLKNQQETSEYLFINFQQDSLAALVNQLQNSCKEFYFNINQAKAPIEIVTAIFNYLKEKLSQKTHQMVCAIVVPNQNIHLYAPLAGLIKSMQIENPKIKTKLIALDQAILTNPSIAAETLRNEMQQNSQHQFVRYDENHARWVQTLNRYASAHLRTDLFSNRVFLITGGLGGLGKKVAEYISQFKNTKIILCGRKAPAIDDQQWMSSLILHGAHVIYEKCDITRADEVQNLIDSIMKNHDSLSGIFHCAGVLKDSLLINKTVSEFEDVLSPKLLGLHWLDTYTKDIALNFVVLFSSVASIKGNIGQVDYAAANAYLDGYVEYRDHLVAKGKRSGRTIAINWPLWAEGGMTLEPHHEDWQLRRTGLSVLRSKLGLEILHGILTLNQSGQIMVAYGVMDKIAQYFNIAVDKQPSANQTSGLIVKNDQNKIRTEVLEIISHMLKIDASQLDFNDNFSEYGIDSILMMRLLNELEKKYQIIMDPNSIIMHPTINQLSEYLINSAGVEQTTENNFESITVKTSNHASQNKVAIIGYTGILPQSPTLEDFWVNLTTGRDLITNPPTDRWGKFSVEDKHITYGGYLNDISSFDAERFAIDDSNALILDPQQRVLLELADDLLKRAGYIDKIKDTNTVVYIGAKENNYVRNNYKEIPKNVIKNTIVSYIGNIIAARISNFYNLRGASKTIDTACSSSLVAMHDACQSILHGESELAIAGGIFLLIDPFAHIGFNNANVLSPDGKSYVFDKRANGFVLSEGAGLVLLKNYNAAIRDGDRIIATILASAINNDGKTMGLTVPNQEGQKEVIHRALSLANINPEQISYYEAHGTGTLLGDPIEVKAASDVYRNYTSKNQFCAIGSVKSNIGHTMMAAGVASIIKILLSMEHNMIPPTIHCESPHPRFNFDKSPFYPIVSTEEWKSRVNRTIAAVSSFGFGGTNSHMILEKMGD